MQATGMRPLTLFVLPFLFSVCFEALGDVWRLRSGEGRATSTSAARKVGLREAYQAGRDVLVRSPRGKMSSTQGFLRRTGIDVQELPDFDLIRFARARFDSSQRRFLDEFEGSTDYDQNSTSGQYLVAFRSQTTPELLQLLEARGVHALEPLSPSAYLAYGSRTAVATLANDARVLTTHEIPAGLKRIGLHRRSSPDATHERTTVLVIDQDPVAVETVRGIGGTECGVSFRMRGMTAYVLDLTIHQAVALSLLSGIAYVRFDATTGGPSDERANRIVGGTFQTPEPSGDAYGAAASWPTGLGTNTSSPAYWDGFLSNLSYLGIDPANQTIAFLDTGVDNGLQESNSSYCPPFLYDGMTCNLVYTSDMTDRFGVPNTRADDNYFHGTLTTSIAAGYRIGGMDLGRDNDDWAFTQGLASGAKVAMMGFLREFIGGAFHDPAGPEPAFTNYDYPTRLRYALVALGNTTTLPDNGMSGPGAGPGARLYNHSWNTGSNDYEGTAIILDQATRMMESATFAFESGVVAGPEETQSLHVVSVGNWNGGECFEDRRVFAPATAKNVISVGATETYNQLGFTDGCDENDEPNADCPRQVTTFTAIGFPNQRLKPDLVAPGTRATGPVSSDFGNSESACNNDLSGNGLYAWHFGTSFAAPLVSGAAALVTEWLKQGSTVGPDIAEPSPAMVKATLLGAAKNLVPVLGGSYGCESGDMKPAPDKYQGWGGLNLDRLFRQYTTNYFVWDQGTTLTPGSPTWVKTLYLSGGTDRDIRIALVWTDRAAVPTIASEANLVNNLDVEVTIVGSSVTRTWYGNYYYTDPDSLSRDGYSLAVPPASAPTNLDAKNNVERIDIKKTQIPSGATSMTITITATALTGDGLDPLATSLTPTLQQDFAIYVENADETP